MEEDEKVTDIGLKQNELNVEQYSIIDCQQLMNISHL